MGSKAPVDGGRRRRRIAKVANRPQPVVAPRPPKRPLIGSGRPGAVTYRRGSSPAGGCGTVEFYSRRNASVMDRRTFIGAVAAGIIAAPLAASAQTATTVRRIGVLSSGARPTPAELQQVYAPLSELGWVRGQESAHRATRRQRQSRAPPTLRGGARSAQGGDHRDKGHGCRAGGQERHDHHTHRHSIPPATPSAAGSVASLARPGGNITGYSIVSPELNAKRLALLRELLPGVQRVGWLENSTNPYYRAARKDLEQACRSLDVQPIFIEVAAASELENAIAELARRRAQALFVQGMACSPQWVQLQALRWVRLPATARCWRLAR